MLLLLGTEASDAVDISRKTSSHLITLSTTHRVQLTEPLMSKLQVVLYEVVLEECRLMDHISADHLHRTATSA